MIFLLGFLRIAWPYLLGAILVGAVYWKTQTWCNTACKAQVTRADKAEARAEAADKIIAAARAEESRIRLAWAAESIDAQKAAIAAKGKTDATFASLTDRARSVPAGSVIRFSSAAVGVFNDATIAANADATAAPASDQAAAGAVSDAPSAPPVVFDEREFTAYVVTSAMAYADAVNQWRACVNWYDALRAAQTKGSP